MKIKKYNFSIRNEKGEEETFEYKNLEQNERSAQHLDDLIDSDNIIAFLKEGGKQGLKGVKRFFIIIFLFTFTNFILITWGLYLLFTGTSSDVTSNLMMVLIGLAGTGYAAYRAYQYAIVDAVKVIYQRLQPFHQKLCDIVVDKAAVLIQSEKKVSNNLLSEVIDVSKILDDSLSQLPFFIKKGVLAILKKIPFIGMVIQVKDEIENGNKPQASIMLFKQVDEFILGLFSKNSTSWILWLLPLNVIIQLIFMSLI